MMPKMTAPTMYEVLGRAKPKASSAARLSFIAIAGRTVKSFLEANQIGYKTSGKLFARGQTADKLAERSQRVQRKIGVP
jgi:hypothetical protein